MSDASRSKSKLPMWPFVLGDVLLILLAVAVLVLSGGSLTAWQVFFCVLGVVVGALLLLVPFVVEYVIWVRYRAAQEKEQMQTLLARWDEAMSEVWRCSESQHEATKRSDGALAVFEEQVGRIGEMLDRIQAEDRQVLDRLSEWRRRLDEIELLVKTNRQEWPEGLSDRIEEGFTAMQARLQELSVTWRESSQQIREEVSGRKTNAAKKAKAEGKQPPKGPKQAEFNDPQWPLEQAAGGNAEEVAEEPPAGSGGPTTLMANVLIGIGNKLYLRGEGGGLSWERGKPLEFVEIGKFRWESPVEGEDMVCRLFLNDTVPAAGEVIRLRAGESIEVTPEFPS